jgi:CRP/FNR family cyclic AMP-dependent transcriptional regulator
MRDHSQLYEPLMVELVGRIRELTGNVKDMALLDVYGRVAHTLERLCSASVDKSPKLTHQDIANMVGASREMVSRVMKELVVGGYIEVQQKHIRILRSFPKNW